MKLDHTPYRLYELRKKPVRPATPESVVEELPEVKQRKKQVVKEFVGKAQQFIEKQKEQQEIEVLSKRKEQERKENKKIKVLEEYSEVMKLVRK